ncbi:hypothetical protein DUNSADRAFT_15164 [Dunaliella salina]|uniref:Radical SAM core domain-containing protein n=1 Tax=Dunaliella salina TaxID=3046 RepID=A0ABQ7G5Z0_DUNSA|nr:hypothetical protein DUNSADRAFT_15164 [Dunaliella salina]|eukprot:KAF5830020.1 hypothetical protein DUNSADRAFT_15164 [Dunaliella salina]
MGLKGNLTAGEIVEQLVHANSISKIRNIVFMGMGEPLNNYEAVRAAIASMVDPTQWGLSRQRVTVSTVGVVNRVKQLGQDLPGIGLALSLHAPNQDLRIQIVPSAKAYHIDKLIESVAAYQHLSKQRIFVEYVLLAGVNDGAEHAHQLGALLSGLKVLLNLIPWNPVLAAKEAHDYSAPSQESILQFQSIVRSNYHVPTTVRQEKGQDIAGACGQLALEKAASAQKGGLGGNRGGPAGTASGGGGGGLGSGGGSDKLALEKAAAVRKDGLGGSRGAPAGTASGGGGGGVLSGGGNLHLQHPEEARCEAGRKVEEWVEQGRGGADNMGVSSSGRGSKRGGLLGLVGGIGGILGGLFWRGAHAPAAEDAAGAAAERSSNTTTSLESTSVAGAADSSTTTQNCNSTACAGSADGSREAGPASSGKGDSEGGRCMSGSSSGEAVQGCCRGAEASTACCAQGTDVSRSDCNQNGLMLNSHSMPGINASNSASGGEDNGHPDASSSSQQGMGRGSSLTGAGATKQMGLSGSPSESTKPSILRDIEELH